MWVHSVAWATGICFRKGAIEDEVLGYRHVVDGRLWEACGYVNSRNSVMVSRLRLLAAKHGIAGQEVDEVFRGLARRGLVVCNPALVRRRFDFISLYVSARELLLGLVDRRGTFFLGGWTRRYSLVQGNGLRFGSVLVRSLMTIQGPLMFGYGLCCSFIGLLYLHMGFWLGVSYSLATVIGTTALHEWAHVIAVRRHGLPAVLLVSPHKLSVVYRHGSRWQRLVVALAGPVLPVVVWVTLSLVLILVSGSANSARALIGLGAVPVAIQSVALLPFMKDGKAVVKALFSNERKYRHVVQQADY